MPQNVLNVLIIGAGNIAAHYDEPGDEAVLSHAHAITRLDSFHLLGFLDQVPVKAVRAKEKWGGEAFRTLEEAFEHPVDVVCVATPDEAHFPVLMALRERATRLIFCEKPLATRLEEGREILQAYEGAGKSLAVNYSRRFVPEFIQIAQNIRQGLYGRLLLGNGFYGKGLFHNGSHLLDLLLYFFQKVEVQRVTSVLTDYRDDDPSVSACLVIQQDAPFYLHHVDSRCHTMFEMDLIFDKGRIRITDLGRSIEVFHTAEDAQFRGYQVLQSAGVQKNRTAEALMDAYQNIEGQLWRREPLHCTGQDALDVLSLCDAIKKSTLTCRS